MLDRKRSSTPHQLAPQQLSRPLSWHPNSYVDFNFNASDISAQTSYMNQYQFNPYCTTAVNGNITPMSYAAPDEPHINELITPLEGLAAYEGQSNYGCLNPFQNFISSNTMKESGYAMDNMFPQTMLHPSWQWGYPSQVPNVPTAPASPAFLPIQGGVEASPLDLNSQNAPSKPEGDELVGMGLYDSPADVQQSSFLFGGGFEGAMKKKSLKLEESFEPAADGSQAEGEEENQDEDEDAPAEESDSQSALDFNPYQEPAPISNQITMVGQSFLFDGDGDSDMISYPVNMNSLPIQGYQMQYPVYSGWG